MPQKIKSARTARGTRTPPRKRSGKLRRVPSEKQQLTVSPNEIEINLLEQTIAELVNMKLSAPPETKFATYAELEQFTSEELIRIHHESLTSRITDQQMEYAESLVKTLNDYPGQLSEPVRPNT